MEKISSWTKLSHSDVMSFCDGYIDYLNASKTERLAVKNAEEIAKNAGFKHFDDVTDLKPGDKIYYKNRNSIYYEPHYKRYRSWYF